MKQATDPIPIAEWSSWRSIEPAVSCRTEVLAEVLDGGQAFRWNRVHPDRWRGVWGKCIAEVRSVAGIVEWRAPVRIEARVARQIADYLVADNRVHADCDQLPWRSDPILKNAMDRWRGLRILRQPFSETLLCFLCSAMKQITHIKQLVESLAQRYGEAILPGIHSLPDWGRLHRVSEAELRACGLGFRARYLHATAHFLAGQPEWLDSVERLPYPEAHARLRELPGVGAKIADCALLFGAARQEAFPVDVWIARVMANQYSLQDWRLNQIAHFGRVHFGASAGLAQQFLFADVRRRKD